MDLQATDLHFEFSRGAERLQIWNAGHRQLFQCEARNRTVNDGQFGFRGNVPDGEFTLGLPIAENTIPFGPFFIPVLDYQNHHTMRDFHREGIGLHGGGSGLSNPFAPHQGWQVTEGCVRLANADLQTVVHLVQTTRQKGGRCYFTVNP